MFASAWTSIIDLQMRTILIEKFLRYENFDDFNAYQYAVASNEKTANKPTNEMLLNKWKWMFWKWNWEEKKEEFDDIWKYDDDDIYFTYVRFDLIYEEIIDDFQVEKNLFKWKIKNRCRRM